MFLPLEFLVLQSDTSSVYARHAQQLGGLKINIVAILDYFPDISTTLSDA